MTKYYCFHKILAELSTHSSHKWSIQIIECIQICLKPSYLPRIKEINGLVSNIIGYL